MGMFVHTCNLCPFLRRMFVRLLYTRLSAGLYAVQRSLKVIQDTHPVSSPLGGDVWTLTQFCQITMCSCVYMHLTYVCQCKCICALLVWQDGSLLHIHQHSHRCSRVTIKSPGYITANGRRSQTIVHVHMTQALCLSTLSDTF